LAWLSSTELGLATALGAVAIFNIPQCSSIPDPKPFFYHNIHSSYILCLVPALPHYPHLLISTSMDGYIKLTDLRSPEMDQSHPSRTRVSNPNLAYIPGLKCVIHSDESDFLRMLPLRRFFSGTNACKASAPVTSIATSQLHPCTLAGAADGTILATNGIRRIINHKNPQYQQCWFIHDFSPTGGVAGQSMSRVLDGFKAEKINLKSSSADTGEGIWTTTWEEGGHVTAVEWNPNVECAGWAVASLGCGLIRVEDVSV
jgi:transcription factor C subunit 6